MLKNYSNLCLDGDLFIDLYMQCKQYCLVILLLFVCINVSAADQVTTPASAIGTSDYLKVLLGLAFVVALFLLSAFLFKRYGNASMIGKGQLRLIDGLHLGNRDRLVLVELKDKQILLSITPGQINKLHTIDVPSSVETTHA